MVFLLKNDNEVATKNITINDRKLKTGAMIKDPINHSNILSRHWFPMVSNEIFVKKVLSWVKKYPVSIQRAGTKGGTHSWLVPMAISLFNLKNPVTIKIARV